MQNLRKKHKRLEAELSSHEPAIQVSRCTVAFVHLLLILSLTARVMLKLCTDPSVIGMPKAIYSPHQSRRLVEWNSKPIENLCAATVLQAISIAPLQVHCYSEALWHRTDTVLEFHAEAPQATASEGLAQGPYLAARVGFESMILWTKGVESTNEPPRPTVCFRCWVDLALLCFAVVCGSSCCVHSVLCEFYHYLDLLE